MKINKAHINFELKKIQINFDQNNSKYENNKIYKSKIVELFKNFCQEIKKYLKLHMGEDIDTTPVDHLYDDYINFFKTPNYNIKFKYINKYVFENEKKNNYTKFELMQDDFKILRDNISEELCTKEDKIKFIVVQILLNIFENLETYIQINSCLTPKQFFNYNYFFDITPRCCFCGQLLEHSLKKTELYVHSDIEHIIPKSKFPQFVLHPDNWAPCCKECNMGEKRVSFFTGQNLQEIIEKYKLAINELALNYMNIHPLKLWKNYQLTYDKFFNVEFNKMFNAANNANEFLKFYGIEKRIKIISSRCYNILFSIIRHSDIRSPESLERLLESMASSNWHEVNDGYSLNNSPHIWQEFIENILYDECKLMALWDEVKDSNKYILR